MARAAAPHIYSIAAHRGFADALVAGLVPRYRDGALGLARLTLLVPSSRAARTISEAFIRHTGITGSAGLLMPRMVAVGDLDLDEALGGLLDPLEATDIPPAVEPNARLFELAQCIEEEMKEAGEQPLPGAARLRLAREIARTIDRLLVEEKSPADLLDTKVLDIAPNLADHWMASIRLFAKVQARWEMRLDERQQVNAATRRNFLFEHTAKHWHSSPPATPIVAAGVTSAAPALARLLRVIANLPEGAVILPDLDLTLSDDAWDELGSAGAPVEPGESAFGKGDALTHPQYHLKLLLNRMGVAREEVQAWHRRGLSAAEPARSHAISSLFLPPQASRTWVELDREKRRMSGVRLITSATSEEEAQAIALLVREALEEPEKRVAVISADRSLARRVAQHLARWNIQADDSAGKPLALTPAGRLFALLAQIMAEGASPATLIAALAHPLVRSDDKELRRDWLRSLRGFERELRGPAPAPGFEPLRTVADKAGEREWWDAVEALLTPLFSQASDLKLADCIGMLINAAEALAGDAIWSREDGRALSSMVEDLRLHARETETTLEAEDIASIITDCMDEIAVRPPYGGHPRVAIYGLLESRMARADLVVCAGLNEGTWPQSPGADPVLAPSVLRALSVPGAEFRIGLAAHDLAGAMGAPEVVLSRAQRDVDGPTIPSRFLLRVEALLGELVTEHTETSIPAILPQIDRAARPSPTRYPRPEPRPNAAQRKVTISATALDRLLGDPYQFYAQQILGLRKLESLEADPFNDPALRGTLVHDILEAWHKAQGEGAGRALVPFAEDFLRERQVHPLFWGLWRPRLLAAFDRFEAWMAEAAQEGRTISAIEARGEMQFDGITVHGRADRIDTQPDGSLAIVDYKTGKPPSAGQVEAGYALQLGVLGLIAGKGGFKGLSKEASVYEYWSLARDKGELGYIDIPMKVGKKRSGLEPEEFLPHHEAKLSEAISKYLNGDAPFTAKENPDYNGYTDYDQLMRLEEWITDHINAASQTVGDA